MTKNLFATMLATILLITLMLGGVPVESKQSTSQQNPLHLIATDIGQYVQLNWDIESEQTTGGFNVYRLNATGSWEKLTQAPVTSPSFVDYSAPRLAVVSYRVTFVDNAGGENSIASDLKISTQKTSVAAGIAEENQELLGVVYNKDDIITDSQLTNANTMSLAQIQTFLSNQGSALANFSVNGKTAAQHIYDACQAHTINPHVVLVTLQKEKGLIRSSSANPNNLAMGWNTGDSSTSGFADQIFWGTRQFKLYLNDIGSYGWTVGQPKTVSDGVVTAANTATAGLYVYTPWIGQGGGGQTGIGGNYLFWDLWQNTFGFNGTVSNPTLEHANGWIYPTGSSNFQYIGWLAQNPNFGNQFHLAQDMANPLGNPVQAIDSGDVIFSTTQACGYGGPSGQLCDSVNRFGGALIIRHRAKDGTWFTALYGHLDSPLPVGRHVFPGDHVGFSNNWNPPHVHFGIRPGPDVTSSTPYRGYTPSTSQLDGFVNPIKFLNDFSACKNGTSVNFRPNNSAPIHPNGTLIKSSTDSTGTVYLLRNGQKQGIVSPDVLRNLYPNGGFDFKDVITIAPDEFNSYPTGSAISSQLPSNGRTHAEGRLIRRATGGEISIVTDNGKRRGFVSASVFSNLGYLFCNVVDATDSNYDSYPAGDPITGTPTSCSGPGSFSLNSPNNGQSLPPTTSVTLSWGASANANSYDVHFGTSSNPPLVGNQPGTSRNVTVTPGQTYFWKVVAKVSCGSATFTTPVSSFSVQEQTYTITLSSSPSTGGNVSGSGTFVEGSSRTVSATANNGFSFSNWTENGNVVSTSPSFTFTLNSNRNLVANFTQNPVNFTITVSASPSTGGNATGGGSFPAGSSRTVTATANSGFSFSNWTENGNAVSTSPSFTFTLNSNRKLVANFTQNPVNFTITVSAAPSTGGSASGGGSFPAGSSRTITATANSGFSFANWTENGTVVSSSASFTFTLNSDRNLVANFTTPSSGGTKIAFTRVVTNQEIYVMNADGSGQVNLTNNPADDYHAAWSPDNSRIGFVSTRNGQHEIYVMNADGSNPVNLTQNAAVDYLPTWSPDGQKILFASDRAGIYELYVMNAAGTNPTRLTFSPAGAIGPDWSADGQKIVFMNFRDGAWNIDSMNADGTGKVALTSGNAFKGYPRWSPDRTRIVYESFQDGLLEIYVMNADGSNQTRLTDLTSMNQHPDWSDDGQKIAFASDRNGPIDVYVMSTDGSNPIRLTHNQGTSWEPVFQSSPTTQLRVNFALVTNGGVATASSTLDAGRTPLGAINGDRTGRHWATAPETGSGWHDATSNAFPDWLQVDFNSVRAIDEINVITLQDNFENPAEPNTDMTFSIYGMTAFEVQYWNGASWVTVPGGGVTGNNKVWRRFSSLNIQTSKIRVLVNSALLSFSRIVELEAWGTAAPPVSRSNVALASNGGVATASSTLDAGRTPLGAINGDRTGRHWASAPETGSGWHDATSNIFPDWLQVDFNGVKTIDEINVITLQDNFENPAEPNTDMTFSIYGVTTFELQYWNGVSWVTVPGGNVTGNNKVWRQFGSLNIQTSKIRVLVNSALLSFSRIVEVEAWGRAATPSRP